MDLRVSLLIIGGLIILAIYYFGRFRLQPQQRRVATDKPAILSKLLQRVRQHFQHDPQSADYHSNQQTTPVLHANELENLEEFIPDRGDTAIKIEETSPVIVELGSEQIAPAGEQLFLPLTLMGKAGQSLSGETIANATQTTGMVLKDDGIYRYQVKDAQGYWQALLGLANILEPGTFSSEHLADMTTPGLVLYLHLPAPIEAREAFDKLIEIGHQLEDLLNAELCDETRSVLTKQTIGHLKEKVEAFRFKQKMTQLQRRGP